MAHNTTFTEIYWLKVRSHNELGALAAHLEQTSYDIWSRPGKTDRNGRFPLMVGHKQPVPPFKVDFGVVCDTEELMKEAVKLLEQFKGEPARRILPTADELNAVWTEIENSGQYPDKEVIDAVCKHFDITFQECSTIIATRAAELKALPNLEVVRIDAAVVKLLVFALYGGGELQATPEEAVQAIMQRRKG